MLLLSISFIAGVLTVLAPCILPLLPVIVGGSLSGDTSQGLHKKKVFTIILSLGISVIAFTLLLKASTIFIDIPEYVWKWISGGIVILLGLVTLFPSLWESKLLVKLSTKSNILLGKGNQKNSFYGDMIVGAALGPVFSTCSPTYFIVIATVLPAKPLVGMIYLFSYVVGLCLALFIVSVVGQKIMDKLDIAANPNGLFKKILGIIFILVGLAVIVGFDKKAQILLLDAGFFDVTRIEQKLLQKNTPRDIQSPVTIPEKEEYDSVLNVEDVKEGDTKTITSNSYLTEKQKSLVYKKVPELSSPDGFVNTEGKPITLAELKGKVVLLDIWTYSCINCQRTIPYINNWYSKYKDQGFVVVGLHTPEFAFEKLISNVEKAVVGFGIKYPVVLDNDYSTWKELGNQYWPRKYLIDIDGYIVYDHIGEGAYEQTEKQIQNVLAERASRLSMDNKITEEISIPNNIINVDFAKVGSPEVYFGYARNSIIENGKNNIAGEQTLTLPETFSLNKVYLGGTWNFTPEYMENKNIAEIVFKYSAKNVYITAGSLNGVEAEIYNDSVLVKKVLIKDEELYTLVNNPDYGLHTLRIKILKAGLKAFTFTFG